MSCDYQQLPHEGIRTLSPYVPGKSIEALAREKGLQRIIKMASNENPLGCSPCAQEALQSLASLQIATYPAPLHHGLRRKLSDKLAVEENTVLLSNGSDWIFSLLLMLFGLHHQKHIITHEKAFSTYAIQAQTLGIPVKYTPLLPDWQVDIAAMSAAVTAETALIFFANPNNPVGCYLSISRIRAFLQTIPATTIVVIDEAYYDYVYTPGDPGALSLLGDFPNLVVTRTFSKAYGLAGLRLGYAVASPEITELLVKIQLPFVVNQAALTAGFAALDDESFLQASRAVNSEGLKQLTAGLKNLNRTVLPVCGNYVTFDCGRDGLLVYQKLLDYGIIVRPLHAYEMPDYLRVTVNTPEHNKIFLEALAVILSNLTQGES